jgi:hypothetical protein
MKQRTKFFLLQTQWVVLVLIIVTPAIVNQMYFDKPSYKTNTTDFKNTFEVGLILSLGILGYFGLRGLQHKWPLNIWKAIYIFGVVFLTIATLVEAFIYRYSYKGQFRFMSIKQLLFSPIIYVLLLLIYKNIAKKENA